MIGNNTPPIPPKADLRALSIQLVEAISDHLTDNRALWQLASDVRAAAERREPSRPDATPDVAAALVTIADMRAGRQIDASGIQAVVALAEEGARQLEQFALRFDADRRAMAAWAEAHPDFRAWVPERDDALVWLMDVFDCSFDRPTVAQVENVRARLGAAQLRAPNALTKDARDIVDQLADALRKTSRRAFMAEERARAAEAANVQWEQPHYRGITHQPVETHRAGSIEQIVISTINGGDVRKMARDAFYADLRPRPASDRAFDALVAEARKAGIVDDDAKVVWRQPGEAGALLATKLGQLTGYPVKDRTEPREWTPHNDYAGEPMPGGVFSDPPECVADPLLAETIAKAVGDMIVWPDGPNDETTLRQLLASSFVADADLLKRAAAIASATILGHVDTEGEAITMFEHLNCPLCGGSGHVEDAEVLRGLIVTLLTALDDIELPDGSGTNGMPATVEDAAGDLAEAIGWTGADDAADRASLDRVAARLDAEVLHAAPANPRLRQIMGGIPDPHHPVEHPEIKAGHNVRADIDGQRFEGVAKEDGRADLTHVGPTPGPDVEQTITIGGKNTADYDRRQMEERINTVLARQFPKGVPALYTGAIDDVVSHLAPGWLFDASQLAVDGPPTVELTRYAPGEPL